MTLDLDHARLLVPAIQAEPLAIHPIEPSPCAHACPAGINVKAYVSLIAEGKYSEALATIRERCPLPGICGRVCHHPCEKVCRRGQYDDPVAIRALKRFAADFGDAFEVPPPPPITHEEKIAVIGSGPAGLTAAYDLRLGGYEVVVFEAEEKAGGMLRYGIADYRLPAAVLDAELDVLIRSGLEIRTGTRVESIDELREAGYAATLVAVGAQSGRHLGIEGEKEASHVEDALSFLRRVKLGERTPPNERVIVIGGGSTAVEAARTALRFGAREVEILYRRYREELLADEEEIDAAESEGARFRFLVAPKRLTPQGLECINIGLGEPDRSGRRRPIEIPGSEFFVAADRILVAVGQETVMPRGVRAGPEFFAAGDAVTGPSTVVAAIAGGHIAAEAIRQFLNGHEATAPVTEPRPVEYEIPDPRPLAASRVSPRLANPYEGDPFREVERAFTEAEAVAEARRCLRCGPCDECRICASTCSRRHVMLHAHDREVAVRTPAAIARAVDDDTPAMVWSVAPRSGVGPVMPPGSLAAAEPATLRAARVSLSEERCRACGKCIDVCSFHALSLRPESKSVMFDEALCRGCGLCTSVCPTHALDLAAEKRAVCDRVHCAGRLDPGALLELYARDGTVGVTACHECRFDHGPRLIEEHRERADGILHALGHGGAS